MKLESCNKVCNTLCYHRSKFGDVMWEVNKILKEICYNENVEKRKKEKGKIKYTKKNKRKKEGVILKV